MTSITEAGYLQLASVVRGWLMAKEFALGTIVDGEIAEVDYPGYERQAVEVESVFLANGRVALKGWVSFDGPTSEGSTAYQVLYILGEDDVITHEKRWDEEQTLPEFGRVRWQVTFNL